MIIKEYGRAKEAGEVFDDLNISLRNISAQAKNK